MICVCLNRTKPWLEWSIKFNQYSFQKALVEFNNLWIHLFFKEFNWISMSKILSSPFKWRAEVGAWEVSLFFVIPEEFVCSFLVYFLIYFFLVDIWPMCYSFNKRIWFTIIFSLSKRVASSDFIFCCCFLFFFVSLPFIMSHLLLSRTRLTKCTPSILMENCDHTICHLYLSYHTILFLYARAHEAWIFEEFIFEL